MILSNEEKAEIAAAFTITLPGGVRLTSEERGFRESHKPPSPERALIVARSILTKVRVACGGGTP
jgi:hypothetical protein